MPVYRLPEYIEAEEVVEEPEEVVGDVPDVEEGTLNLTIGESIVSCAHMKREVPAGVSFVLRCEPFGRPSLRFRPCDPISIRRGGVYAARSVPQARIPCVVCRP